MSRILSTEEFAALVAARGDREQYIDLIGLNVSKIDLSVLPPDPAEPQRRLLREVRFGARDREPAQVGSLSFGNIHLYDCSLSHVVLKETYLRGARLTKCDCRYLKIFGATFQDTEILSCDFYRAVFERPSSRIRG